MSHRIKKHLGRAYYLHDAEWGALKRRKLKRASCDVCGRKRVSYSLLGRRLCFKCWFEASHANHELLRRKVVMCASCHLDSLKNSSS